MFKFINHASFLLESDQSILLIDPWLEGSAFNNGWHLVDRSTSNIEMVNYLIKKNKKIFIWYSHEHSDHFSISFLKSIKNLDNIKIIYQKTHDNRVKSFLVANNFQVIVPKAGKEFLIEDNFKITTWPYRGGDSLCLINFFGIYILNINDCEINSDEDSKKVLFEINKKTSKIDFLLTQFGYACWNGNEDEKELRVKAAEEKLTSMENQIKVFKPSCIIPFASFIFFSNDKNFYINNEQNKVSSLREHSYLGSLENIYFLKPLAEFDILNVEKNDLRKKSKIAEKHYSNLYNKIKPIIGADPNELNEKEIIEISLKYLKTINNSFLYLFSLKKLNIRILIEDVNKVLELDYSKKPKLDSMSFFDLKMTSDTLSFILNNLFGFNTIHVSGVFRVNSSNSISKAEAFFWPQSLLKFGFGIKKPVSTILFLIKSKIGIKNSLF